MMQNHGCFDMQILNIPVIPPLHPMKKFQFVLQNARMKEHFVMSQQEAGSLFYRNHETNRTDKLPFYRTKEMFNCLKSCGYYPYRVGKCFPAAAPFVSPVMVPRTTFAHRPLSPPDIQRVSHRRIH